RDVREELAGPLVIEDVPGAGHAAGRGLEPGDPAEVGGETDAAAGVAADVERGASRGHDRAGAPARSPRGALDVVRIAGAPEDEVVRLVAQREVGRVRLALDDRPRRVEAC